MSHGTELTPMDGPDPAQSVEFLYPPIESFFQRMTPEKWTVLQAGEPDNATKSILAELFLELISCISQVILIELSDDKLSYIKIMSEEDVRTATETFISGILEEFLDINRPCSSSELLKGLIVAEITHNIHSDLSKPVGLEEPLINRMTPPNKIADMVRHACKIVKACIPEVKLRRQQMTTRDNIYQESQASMPVKPLSQVAAVSQILQEVVYKELYSITDTLLDNLSDLEYDLFRNQWIKEMKLFADKAAESAFIKVENINNSVSATEDKSEHELMPIEEILSEYINSFFAQQFTKASIVRSAVQLKAQLFLNPETEVQVKESMLFLLGTIDSLFVAETNRKVGVCTFWKLKQLSSGKISNFRKALVDLLFGYARQRKTPWISQKVIRTKIRKMPLPRTDKPLYKFAQNKVRCSLQLTNWWLNNEARNTSENVMLTVQPKILSKLQLSEDSIIEELQFLSSDDESIYEAAEHEVSPVIAECKENQGEPVQDTKAQATPCKEFVKLYVTHLVTRIYKKAKTYMSPGDSEVINRLYDKTWAGIKDIDFDISKFSFGDLSKKVFKELLKKYGCAGKVLLSMILLEPEFENHIISFLKRNLTKIKQPSPICRFFHSVAEIISNVFRSRNRVGVINTQP